MMPAKSGGPISIARSKRPGRSNAESIASSRFVVAHKITRSFLALSHRKSRSLEIGIHQSALRELDDDPEKLDRLGIPSSSSISSKHATLLAASDLAFWKTALCSCSTIPR